MPKKPEVPVEPKGFAMPLQTTITALPEIEAVTSEVAPIVSPVQQIDVEPAYVAPKPAISWNIPKSSPVQSVSNVMSTPTHVTRLRLLLILFLRADT